MERVDPPANALACFGATPLFRGLPADVLEVVANTARWQVASGGEQVLGPRDVVDSLLIVAIGRLRVVSDVTPVRATYVRDVGHGESIGERWILDGEPSGCTIRAVRDTVFARVSCAQLEALFERHSSLARSFAHVLARDVGSTSRPWSPDNARTVAIVPLSRDAPLAEFTDRLSRAVMAYGPVLHLSAERFESLAGSGCSAIDEEDARDGELTQWLNRQVAAHHLVIFESSVEPSAWSRRCLRQADGVLAVALTDAGPRDREIAPVFFDALNYRGDVDAQAVLVHEDGNLRPVASNAWLALHPFTAHHHLRMTSTGDFERIARTLVGRSVGVVLGGGGARAYAHIGVIVALEEAGIPIDRIGGTSTGALIAAQYAFGFPSGALAAVNRRDWVDQHPLRDYTIPLTALLSGKRSRRVLERWFGDERIEDMWLPFFCVSASLKRAETVIHRDGPIAKWVRASASIPGIVPPVDTDDGDMFVDGALLNNVPADVMRATARGPVIAVDVTRPVDLSRSITGSHALPRPRAGSALESSSADGRIPAILRIILQSTLLSSRSLAKRVRGESDLYLTPPVGGFDMFDWNALERIVDTGYRYAQSAIAQWEGREALLKGGRSRG